MALQNTKKKNGYKLTEAGIIPDDWIAIALGNLGTWKGGATPSMRNASFWENGTIPWVSSGDVKRTVLWDTAMKITRRAVDESSTTLLPSESLLFVTRSGILRKYLPVARNSRPLAINQDIKALIPISHHAGFLLHLFLWSGPKILGTCLKSGTTVESIDFRWLKEFIVPLPPERAEQAAIADVLSTTDALIVRLEDLMVKKKNIKQGAMHELLTGERRLPGFSDEWTWKTLESIADIQKGRGLSKNIISSSGGDCILYGELFTHYKEEIRTVKSRTTASGGVTSVYGDVLIPASTTTSGIDLAKASALLLEGVLLGGDINIIRRRSGDEYDPSFLAYSLTHIYKHDIAKKAKGITIYHLHGKDLRDIQVKMPGRSEQEAVSYIISEMDDEIDRLNDQLMKYRNLKQGMMQQLLTGKIRLL